MPTRRFLRKKKKDYARKKNMNFSCHSELVPLGSASQLVCENFPNFLAEKRALKPCSVQFLFETKLASVMSTFHNGLGENPGPESRNLKLPAQAFLHRRNFFSIFLILGSIR
jgi:hypothetical protein